MQFHVTLTHTTDNTLHEWDFPENTTIGEIHKRAQDYISTTRSEHGYTGGDFHLTVTWA
jgi:hypothetical protein